MRWSLKLGTIAGIGLYVHATFLILVVWVAIAHWIAERNIESALAGVLFILGIFVCVVLHEFGHALAAKRYGIQTKDVTLLPIGGIARLERMPDDPKQELVVAFAGPAVNAAIAAVFFAGIALSGGGLVGSEAMRGSFVERLLAVNVMLVAFNMLPAFPMDGGRVLRALLAMRMPYLRATRIAATVGQGMALLFGFVGLFANPFLLCIALFVWIGAAQEANIVAVRAMLADVPVRAAMVTDFRTLSPHDDLGHAVDALLSGSQHDFPVVEGEELRGILSRADLIAGLSKHGRGVPVADVMRRSYETAEWGERLEGVLRKLQGAELHSMPVLRAGRLVGLVTLENIAELLMVRSALDGNNGAAASVLVRT
jgi:Zn-dependent protease